MNEPQFHSVDPKTLTVSVEELVNPEHPAEDADYSVPVPTQEQKVLLRRAQVTLHGDELGQYRGRIGGC